MKQSLLIRTVSFMVFVFIVSLLTACARKNESLQINRTAFLTDTSQLLKVDFSISNGLGHPAIFGEGGAPDDATTATNIMNQGFTLTRTGCDMNWLLGDPAKITLSDYKNDVNGIRTDASKVWLSNARELSNYRSQGNKFIVTIGYIPTWLSYNPNSVNGVPKDWPVFEEIVQKVYLKYKAYNSLAYVEIWNEPTGQFLDLTGSPYKTRLSAYRDIYYHTARAIRAIDTEIPLGGPTAGDSKAWCIAWADSMLSDNRIAKDVNFLSYHLYDKSAGTDPADIANWQAVAARHGRVDMPVLITEYNYSYDLGVITMNNESTDAISYIGKRLTDFYTSHLYAASIYSMFQYSSTNKWRQDMCGIFENGTLMPKVRTFYLMSKILGLGSGVSALRQIHYTANKSITNAGCAITSGHQKVIWLVNDTKTPDSLSVGIKGLSLSTQYVASVWEASAANNAQSERQSIKFLTDITGNGQLKFNIAAKSVTGIIIK